MGFNSGFKGLTSALDGVGGQRHARFFPGKELGPVWTGAENLILTGIRSPDRSARSRSLYRLSYSGVSFNKRNTQELATIGKIMQ